MMLQLRFFGVVFYLLCCILDWQKKITCFTFSSEK